jgi:DNA-binding winged helix-turn-helix (wHTH) protein
MAYRFGPFLYDPVSHGLMRQGAEIPLTHKSRELLLLFLNHPGRLLTLEEITDRVWPDIAITDDAVRFQVGELRRAFGEGGEGFIRTMRREGYRWEAPVRGEAHRPVQPPPSEADGKWQEPRYRLVLEEREVQILEGENVIGREPDAALWIDHASVSRRHARIVVAEGEVKLEDLESKNGTLLNDKRIDQKCLLRDGDQIQVGPLKMVFRSMSPLGSTQTEKGTR